MNRSRESWAIVLAAGEGSRLRALTTDESGVLIPKQFCSLRGGPSLLQLALQRAARVVSPDKIATIVAGQHECWWREELRQLPPSNLIVQPCNRGTGTGLLLPLLTIVLRDPGARIVVIPSDHFINDEAVLTQAIEEALTDIERRPEGIVLLGIVPDAPDEEFGWIVPSAHAIAEVSNVECFVEKPPVPLAMELMRQGALWNSFIFVADGQRILALFEERMPLLVDSLWRAFSPSASVMIDQAVLSAVYEKLESCDFCQDLLQGAERELRVIPVPPCGWSDLGTPERVQRCVERMAPRRTVRDWEGPAISAGIDLAVGHF